MKFLLAICMILGTSLAWAAGDNMPPASGAVVVKGKVLEVKSVDHFTYLHLATKDGEEWAAVLEAPVKKGDTVTVQNAIVMQNFYSKSLKRNFKKILLGTLAGAANSPAGPPSLGDSFSINPRRQPDTVSMAPVAKASGANAMTVAEIVNKAHELKGKTVAVRGRVIKYNADIMDKNWVHLRDGSGSIADGTDSILVTTTDDTKVGDVVTARGVVNVDQDFGAGYAYKLLIEKATLEK